MSLIKIRSLLVLGNFPVDGRSATGQSRAIRTSFKPFMIDLLRSARQKEEVNEPLRASVIASKKESGRGQASPALTYSFPAVTEPNQAGVGGAGAASAALIFSANSGLILAVDLHLG